MTLTRRAVLGASAASGVAFAARSLGAQQPDYPARSVRVVVPYAAGGGADTIGRILFASLSEATGQQFVIDNRGGGGGTIGASAVAKAPADGYTILFDASAHAVNVSLFEKLPYNTLKDFEAVFLASVVPNILVATPSQSVRSVTEVIALSKSTPGGLGFASSGLGGMQHLALELFRGATGANITHIPYRGGGPALNDVISGHVNFMFANAAASTGHIKGGSIRAIAHTSRDPLPAFPDLPPVSALVPGFEAYDWNAAFVPAGTPPAIVGRLNALFNDAVRRADVADRLAGLNVQQRPGTPADARRFVLAEVEKWGKVVRDGNIKPDQ